MRHIGFLAERTLMSNISLPSAMVFPCDSIIIRECSIPDLTMEGRSVIKQLRIVRPGTMPWKT